MSELCSDKSQQKLDAGTPKEHNRMETLDKAVDVSQPISILINSVSLGEEACIPAERTAQAKMQSVFQQVRKQVQSQVSSTVPCNSIVELVQRVKSRELEIAKVKDRNDTEKKGPEILDTPCTGEMNVTKEGLIAVFQQELEASKGALRDEFNQQISQLRIELQAYTNRALKGLESKVQSRQTSHSTLQRMYQAEHLETRSRDKKKKVPAAPFLGPGKTRVLNRTMTTLNPKTCSPIVLGPRSKSETMSSSRDKSSLLLKDPDFRVLSSRTPKYLQPCGPLPPTCSSHNNRKTIIHTKAQAGK